MTRRTYKIMNYVMELIVWLLSVVIIYPVLMVVITSFKKKSEANVLSVKLPQHWLVENYIKVWIDGRIFNSFMNSLFITISSVVLLLVFSSVLSYVLVRRETKICKLISRFLTFGIIAPMAALPTIQLLRELGIYGARISLVLVYSALFLPFSTMLYSSFIKGIPKELDEAAVIDGLSGTRLFVRIILPLLKPVTATTGVLNFMWVWNDFQYPLYLLNSSSKWTLPLSVYNFFGQFSRSWNLVCADMVIVSIPIVIVYAAAQKYIITGMTAGAVKG